MNNDEIINKIKSNLKTNYEIKNAIKNSILNKFDSAFKIASKENKTIILNIVGRPGTGKTHAVIESKIIESKKLYIINDEYKEINGNTNNIYIDGANEIEQNELNKIIHHLIKNDTRIILITSWERVEYNGIETLSFSIESKSNPKEIASANNKKIRDEDVWLLKQLNYRQLHLLFENTTQEQLYKNSWDYLQKCFENIILKCDVEREKNKYKNKWEEFKNEFIIENERFPFITFSEKNNKWKDGLKKLALIQNNGERIYAK